MAASYLLRLALSLLLYLALNFLQVADWCCNVGLVLCAVMSVGFFFLEFCLAFLLQDFCFVVHVLVLVFGIALSRSAIASVFSSW